MTVPGARERSGVRSLPGRSLISMITIPRSIHARTPWGKIETQFFPDRLGQLHQLSEKDLNNGGSRDARRNTPEIVKYFLLNGSMFPGVGFYVLSRCGTLYRQTPNL
jgi:hypothetical protein